MVGTTKQKLWDGALMQLGDRKVGTSESGEARRALDIVYDDVVEHCLKQGSWNFAMESVQLDCDTGVSVNFGGAEKVFAKPTDWLRTYSISGDEDFNEPLMNYVDEQSRIVAPVTPIYAQYVSNDTGLGLDLTRWPTDFTFYVQLELASRVCMRLTNDRELKKYLEEKTMRLKREAKAADAMDERTKFPPPSSWTKSRYGPRSGGRWDRGKRSSLWG